MTAAERADPPVTIAEARTILRRGVLSSAAKECGMDWQRRNFEPMTRYLAPADEEERTSDDAHRVLHGIMQGMTEARFRGKCTDQLRGNRESGLDFKP